MLQTNLEHLFSKQKRKKSGGKPNCGFLACTVMDCCMVMLSVKNQKVYYLSEGSSSNHLQDFKVVFVQPHLLHFGGEGFSCREERRQRSG